MADLSGFDASGVNPAGGFSPIPEGDYVATIIASEMKKTSKGTGSYLELTFELFESKFKGRKLWSRLNLENPNRQAVDIAHAELSAICHAVGVLRPADSSELHDRPLSIQVVQRKRSDNGELTNEIKKYSPTADPTLPPVAADKSPWG